MYNFETFHNATFACFRSCAAPDRAPDFVSPSGSVYWDLGSGVVRRSDHWMYNIKSCSWLLDGACVKTFKPVTGYCAYSDFSGWVDACMLRVDGQIGVYGIEPGMTVRVTRTWTEKVGRSFKTLSERTTLAVERITDDFVVAGGRRFKKSTLSKARVVA